MMARSVSRDAAGRVRQDISIQRLLEWAFADECASVDFEDPGTLAVGYGYIGNAGRMADYGALGCRVVGGGRSWPDADADIVASAVACLPEGCGGRRMAVSIAEWARARSGPDAMVDAELRCVPVEVHQNRHGVRSKVQELQFTDCMTGLPRVGGKAWPVRYTVSAAQIASARRIYLEWRLALLELRNTFQVHNNLSRWSVSDLLPPLEPWKKVLR